VFTQNIDGLEQLAGVPPERVVAAHGSFDSEWAAAALVGPGVWLVGWGVAGCPCAWGESIVQSTRLLARARILLTFPPPRRFSSSSSATPHPPPSLRPPPQPNPTAGAHCIDCKRAASMYAVQAAVYDDGVCTCGACGGLVKPDIVVGVWVVGCWVWRVVTGWGCRGAVRGWSLPVKWMGSEPFPLM